MGFGHISAETILQHSPNPGYSNTSVLGTTETYFTAFRELYCTCPHWFPFESQLDASTVQHHFANAKLASDWDSKGNQWGQVQYNSTECGKTCFCGPQNTCISIPRVGRVLEYCFSRDNMTESHRYRYRKKVIHDLGKNRSKIWSKVV